MGKYNVSNRDLILFLGITFGLTVIMGIAMRLAYPTYSVDSFPLVQMNYPAIGVMAALLLNKKWRNELPKNFFKTYLFITITLIIYLLVEVFVFHQNPDIHLEIWIMLGSFSLIIAYNSDSKEKIEKFGLKFKKNVKSSIIYILLFVALYLTAIFISSILAGEVHSFIEPFKSLKKWSVLLLMPLLFAFSFISFLGEEYGWRYFLQPALQERIGKRKGVIVLGLIWGIWHLPVNMFYYSPETPLHSVINQLIICIGYSVFLGYVYMKTENIWTISMIHFINNGLGGILYGGTGTNLVFTWKSVFINLLFFSILYMPFLLAKEYRKSDIDMVEAVEYTGEEIEVTEKDIER
ncbi:CPBP family intramembrane metalloprotease [Tissierella carlieri]|uniref:CPBP family intramembrane metalloprotease n=1 Tax=Tissierella carlieri TaxID=689904 RepID=A0ABT1SH02_9FIRM|nr:type II CAAX endopeptidase family protein [Tissierella carlieri]MBU5313963.1 CPBP family intramembrane metalloprotease [Tissierella carlieri]MCQ4925774.1 CPBP family intramembrane metalloprotease [Tissierella carlieri]